MSVALNTKHLSSFISEEEYAAIYPQVEAAHKQLEAKNGPGSDFLGWMTLPRDYDKEEFARIKAAAAKIREDSDVLVVAGIGGSYLGARAVVEAVKGMYHNELDNGLKIYFCGNTISPTALNDIIKLTKGKCGLCSTVCSAGAIDYEQKETFVEEKYGAIVAATGYNPINIDGYDEFAYSQSKDVVTSLEFERILKADGPTEGHLQRLSDGKQPKTLVFVQCVGSRESGSQHGCGKEYCSKICCMYTAKHAMLIRDKYPDTNVTVFYIDVRTPGKNFDEFYRRAVEQYGVNYIKGQVGKVIPQPDGSLLVQGSDLIDNKQILKKADMVVLATAIEPNPDVRKIATMLTASIDTNNFLTEAHAKLRPVESPTAGIFLSGVCQGPKDIPETVAQAGAAAVKAIGLLAKDKLTTNPCTAKSDELLCNGCSTCANVCPYGAISYEDKQVNDHGIRETRRVAVVNTALCQGCGACTVACPSGAMDLQGFSNRQIIAEVDAICR